MAKNITAYIDIGTSSTRVAFFNRDGKDDINPVGAGSAPSKGIRHGYIINQSEATSAITKAIAAATKSSSVTTGHAVIAISGKGIESIIATGTAIISKSDQEVTQFDIDKAISEAENGLNLQNKKVIHQSPILFKIDGKEVLGRPEKTKGIKLEVKMLFVTCFIQQLDEAVEAVTSAGLEVIDVIPAPLAAGAIALTEAQKIAGVILVDIGQDTTSFAVYENNVPISVHVLPFGGNHITNDIALGLRIPLEDAEKIKQGGDHTFSKKKLEDIIEARLGEMFELIDKYLKRLGRSGMLPAGIILIGNGALHPRAAAIAEKTLSIPARIGGLESPGYSKIKMKDHGWFSAMGLPFTSSATKRPGGSFWFEIKKMFKNAISQLTP